MKVITHKALRAGKPSTTLFFEGQDSIDIDGHLSVDDMVNILEHDVLVIEYEASPFVIRTSLITHMHHTNQ